MPEEITLKILGNRKPVIFVEGEHGNYDERLYRVIYSSHLVIPRSGAKQVIDSTKAVNDLDAAFHNWTARGIIDRDFRLDAEIEYLAQSNVYSLQVAEVENIFCTEVVIRAYATFMHLDADAVFNAAKERVFEKFAEQLDRQVIQRTASIIEKTYFKTLGGRFESIADLETRLTNISQEQDPRRIYDDGIALFRKILNERDYAAVLKVYNQKGLVGEIARTIDHALSTSQYIKLLLVLISNEPDLREGIKQYLPQFPED